METFQILSNQFSHFQHSFHRWLAIFCIISSYIFDLSSSPHTWGIPGSITWSQQWRTVHPHIRGAYVHICQPLGRCPRFIPTYVGHTAAGRSCAGSAPVHPHIRGAYPDAQNGHAVFFGSSPHTWGILSGRSEPTPCTRFIPTYVGHTRMILAKDFSPSVHPHIRGAYALGGIAEVADARFIPTYVGHTSAFVTNSGSAAVHPHIRGAYQGGNTMKMTENGSSPHTWGIRATPSHAVEEQRFIPTYVGHTSCLFAVRPIHTVHPHIRGAYRAGGTIPRPSGGSSPHTWGIHNVSSVPPVGRRFIPTYVGHTEWAAMDADVVSVHPHIRGAYFCEA